ncbi:tetraacyldisaccharide 4'-kinase [Ursidibacter arcticus]|uniref:Trm112 family protein n=1 Tax=Ursidibacter arcticus TaxID=1524965 RepID=UPI0012FA1866|nr:Trm112 family protein [Ursidibacter arcticus]KAE9536216.1 tetraacyldisaccharide 4'-kinase [Ursidibacter arcticus]
MNEKLLNTIACPLTHQKLEWDKENNHLINRDAKLAYPIENGIPVLLPEKAEQVSL